MIIFDQNFIMEILILKIIHIVFFVAWFAGLFYLGRLFVYHKESYNLPENEGLILRNQYKLMESRLYRYICNPAMMITWTAGLLMLYFHGLDWLRQNSWMHSKLTLLVLLTVYHVLCKIQMKKLAVGESKFTSVGFRYFNELPTLFLIAIVTLAVLRGSVNSMIVFGVGLLAIVVLSIFVVSKNKN